LLRRRHARRSAPFHLWGSFRTRSGPSAPAPYEGHPCAGLGGCARAGRAARLPVSSRRGVAVQSWGSLAATPHLACRAGPRGRRSPGGSRSLRHECAPRRHGAAAGRTSLALEPRDPPRVPAPPRAAPPFTARSSTRTNARRLSITGGRRRQAVSETAPVGAWGHRRVQSLLTRHRRAYEIGPVSDIPSCREPAHSGHRRRLEWTPGRLSRMGIGPVPRGWSSVGPATGAVDDRHSRQTFARAAVFRHPGPFEVVSAGYEVACAS
jgi:hypothetical protein